MKPAPSSNEHLARLERMKLPFPSTAKRRLYDAEIQILTRRDKEFKVPLTMPTQLWRMHPELHIEVAFTHLVARTAWCHSNRPRRRRPYRTGDRAELKPGVVVRRPRPLSPAPFPEIYGVSLPAYGPVTDEALRRVGFLGSDARRRQWPVKMRRHIKAVLNCLRQLHERQTRRSALSQMDLLQRRLSELDPDSDAYVDALADLAWWEEMEPARAAAAAATEAEDAAWSEA